MPITSSVFIATSLDGFIARPDGSLDWLVGSDPSDSEDYGYNDFFSSIDVMILGRKTFETVLGFSPWPYQERRVVVLSNTLSAAAVPAELADRVSITQESPSELLSRMEREGYRHAYVDGGATIQAFLLESAVATLTLTRIPVLLGAGIPLFGWLESDVHLEHIETQSYPSGFVQSTYRVQAGAERRIGRGGDA